ncbi:Cytochrome b561 [Durusdinium trenchii]|uniref:DM13 and DOMON domain-containing protein At5g54830 (Protein b561A.tha1) n=1 Tax=Durusdinium trenchii TaxID=1381693 RepID=A0ABP0H8C8_9DINO
MEQPLSAITDPKVVLANERTYIGWVKMSATLGGIAAGLLAAASDHAQVEASDGGVVSSATAVSRVRLSASAWEGRDYSHIAEESFPLVLGGILTLALTAVLIIDITLGESVDAVSGQRWCRKRRSRRMMGARLVAVVVATVVASCTFTHAQPTWSEVAVTGTRPPPRSLGLLADAGSNTLVLFGGETPDGDALNDVWTLDLVGLTWTQVVPVAGPRPVPRFSFVGGVDQVNNRLVIFGGEDQDKTIYNDVWELDLGTSTWTQLQTGDEAGSPEPRYGSAGGVLQLSSGPYLLVSHGFDTSVRERFSNSFAFNIDTQTWLDITPPGELPTGRCLVAGAVMVDPTDATQTKLGMYGGCGSGGYGPCPSSEMWTLTTSGINGGTPSSSWEKAPTCTFARNWAAMASDPTFDSGTFFMYGGDGGPLVGEDEGGQINSINLDTYEWTQSVVGGSSVPGQPSGRQQSAMVAVGSVVYLALGESNKVFQLDYSTVTSLEGVGSAVECHADPIPAWRTAHGVLMGLSWGFLIPLAVLIARFGRIKDPLWFKIHRAANALGVIMSTFGFVISMLMVSEGRFLALEHSLIGLVVTVLGLAQPINAYFRPHAEKGAEKTKGRKRWEGLHKYGGRIAVVLGLVNPFIGLTYLTTTDSAGFIIYALWVAVLVIGFSYLTAHHQ